MSDSSRMHSEEQHQALNVWSFGCEQFVMHLSLMSVLNSSGTLQHSIGSFENFGHDLQVLSSRFVVSTCTKSSDFSDEILYKRKQTISMTPVKNRMIDIYRIRPEKENCHDRFHGANNFCVITFRIEKCQALFSCVLTFCLKLFSGRKLQEAIEEVNCSTRYRMCLWVTLFIGCEVTFKFILAVKSVILTKEFWKEQSKLF